jgi:phosphoserine phosphatase RsbU/P
MPSALIVGEAASAVQELANALQVAGIETRRVTPHELATRPGVAGQPDMLLLPASLGLQRVSLLAGRVTDKGREPTTVVYPGGDDVAELETCVRAGFEYITPPFRPALVRSRLISCWERGQLTLAVQEMVNAATLHSYERDLSVAREIQDGFLPSVLPVPSGWQVAARSRPAHVVGGDFYDVFRLAGGRRLALVIADVCDKGVGAALFMALIRTMLRNTAEQAGGWNLFTGDLVSAMAQSRESTLEPILSVGAGPLLQAVSTTNSYMARHHQQQGYFCTLFFAVLEPVSGSVLYINGGHDPGVLIRADGSSALLAPTGPAVGMYAASTYTVGHVVLAPGDSLFLYTDGVTEARGPDGTFFGFGRMIEAVRSAKESPVELVDTVDAAVRAHTGSAEQHDDITMLAVRNSPEGKSGRSDRPDINVDTEYGSW